MLSTSPPIPSIRITPAPQVKVYPEPYSPIPSSKPDADDDAYRAKWLSVPPITLPWRSSPLRPTDSQRGLGRDQLDSLLSLSRDQRARLGMQMTPDLRKELVLKNQRLKQLERRAVFLSRVKAVVCDAPLKSPICPILPRAFESGVVAKDSADEALVGFSPNLGSNRQAEFGLTLSIQPFMNLKSPPPLTMKSRRAPPSLYL